MEKVKARASIEFNNEIASPVISFGNNPLLDENYNYEISLELNPSISFTQNIKYDDSLIEIIESSIQLNNYLIDDFPELIALNNILKSILEKRINILDTIDEIAFSEKESYSSILTYLNNNPILKDKIIILNGYFTLDKIDEIKKVAQVFKEYPNIKIKLEGNTEPVSISTSLKTIAKIENIVNKIKKYDFSPLEQIMYTYDLIRDRVYKEENENDIATKSRDLSEVLFGDEIVCVGYAEIFHHILKQLGIKGSIWTLKGTEGHARNAIYIKDDKYEIDGLYFFDPTWDSKKEAGNNSYLSSYRYFARIKKDFANIDYVLSLVDNSFPVYSLKNHFIYQLCIAEKMYDKVPVDYAKTINHISSILDDGEVNIPCIMSTIRGSKYLTEDIQIDSEKILPKLIEYSEALNSPIDTDKLLKALLNVRKIEYYEDDFKYPFTNEELDKIASKSLWPPLDYVYECNDRYEIEKQINEVRLTKTLRKIYEQKKDTI